MYHSPRELGMGLLETWPYHVDLCGTINLFQRLEKNKRIEARRERQQSLGPAAKSQASLLTSDWVSASRFSTDLTFTVK